MTFIFVSIMGQIIARVCAFLLGRWSPDVSIATPVSREMEMQAKIAEKQQELFRLREWLDRAYLGYSAGECDRLGESYPLPIGDEVDSVKIDMCC